MSIERETALTATDPSRRDQLDDGVERFRTVTILGRGGMGVVYLARAIDASGRAELAVVKRIRRELRSSGWAIERFVDEARIAARLRHPNVIGVERFGEDRCGPFLVSPYVEGACLDELIDRARGRARVDPSVSLRIVLDLVAGLRAVHEARDVDGTSLGIVHGDVSCENVLVGVDGVARLLDFGAAHASFVDRARARSFVVGKALYTAPDAIHGSIVEPSGGVYGAGVTAWIALASREPWPGEDDRAIVRRAREEGVPPLSSAGVDVPRSIERVIRSATAACACDRFASIAELEAALRDACDGRAASPRDVGALVSTLFGADIEARRALAADASIEPLDPDEDVVSGLCVRASGLLGPLPNRNLTERCAHR